jgi:hypothetical protein
MSPFRDKDLRSLSGLNVLTGNQKQSRTYGSQLSHDSPIWRSGDGSDELSLTVLFTTVFGTLSALREAARLAHQLSARIRILVPHVVPYPLPIDRPRVEPEFRLRQFRTLRQQEPIETRIDVRLCRNAHQCILDSLPPNSVIVIGDCGGWWPLSYERCLVRRLRNAGHQIVPVGHTQGRREELLSECKR